MKKCTLTRKKRKKHRKAESSISSRKEISNLQRKDAEIKVDLVLQAGAKLSDNKVNGPEDATVNEMIKKLYMEKIYTFASAFEKKSWVRRNLPVLGRL